jgi:CRP-like cAMP-binding protein
MVAAAPPAAAPGAAPPLVAPPRPPALPRAKHDAFTRRLLELCSGAPEAGSGRGGGGDNSGPAGERGEAEIFFIRDRLHERCAFFRLWPPQLQALVCRLAAARCGGGRVRRAGRRQGPCSLSRRPPSPDARSWPPHSCRVWARNEFVIGQGSRCGALPAPARPAARLAATLQRQARSHARALKAPPHPPTPRPPRPTHVYIVVEGTFAVAVRSSLGGGGGAGAGGGPSASACGASALHDVALLQEGDTFGEAALLVGAPRRGPRVRAWRQVPTPLVPRRGPPTPPPPRPSQGAERQPAFVVARSARAATLAVDSAALAELMAAEWRPGGGGGGSAATAARRRRES